MKTTRTSVQLSTLLLALTMLIPAAQARGGNIDTTAQKDMVQVQKEINKALSREVVYPIEVRDGEMIGSVLVHFTLSADGHLDLITSNSQNKRLLDHVNGKLAQVVIKNISATMVDRVMSINIVFREEGTT